MQARKNIDMRSLRFFVDLLATGSLQKTGDNFVGGRQKRNISVRRI